MRFWFVRWFGALLCCVMTGPALAQEALPAECRDLPAQPATPEEQGFSAREACVLQARVREALAQGRWLQAELLLERLLMFQPNNAQALIDLATVLAAQNRGAGAQALIAVLRDDARTPAGERRHLQQLIDSIDEPASSQPLASAAREAAQPGGRSQFAWTFGYSTNPLARTSARSVTLTLDGGDVELPLAGRPRGGATFNALWYRRWESGLELLAGAQGANVPGAVTGGRVSLAAPVPDTALYWSVNSQRALDGARRDAARLHWGGPLAGGGERLYSLGAYRESAGARRGLMLRAHRRWAPRAVAHVPARFEGWLEYEHSFSGPPGALRAGAGSRWALAPAWQLQAWLHAQRDLGGYSPLLRNRATRHLATAYVAIEHQWPGRWLGGQWTATAYVSRRWSNLPLFAWRDEGLTFGWVRNW